MLGQDLEIIVSGKPAVIATYQTIFPLLFLGVGLAAAILIGWLFYLSQKFKRLLSEADSANHAKSMFLANISHEVRTPLHGIIGTSSLMKYTDLTPKQARYVQILNSSAHHLLGLINNLLDITKIETDSMPMNYDPCNIQYLCQEVIEMLQVKASEKNIALRFSYKQNLFGEFKAPIHPLKQLLINLIGNGIKYTDKGWVELDVELNPYKENQVLLELAIRDTGIGIAKDKSHLVFSKFSQLDYNESTKRGGTGLGLFLSKALVEKMHGKIWFQSQLGQGTVFYVTIPLIYSNPIQSKNENEHPLSERDSISR